MVMENQSTLLSVHVKLMGSSLLSVTPCPTSPNIFYLNDKQISRVEILGVVTSLDHKPEKFLRFTIDDSTQTVPCVLWLNQLTSPFFASRQPGMRRILYDMANRFADDLQIGKVARVRGKITTFRDELQVTVSDIVIENDPNVETLHRLECIDLGRRVYFA